jgi:hypothetical protein
MIVVRDVFDVYPDRIAEAEALIRELQTAGVQVGLGPARVMVDRTDSYFDRPGEYGHLVVEREFATVDEFSTKSSSAMTDDRWHRAWTVCKPVVRRARREILEAIG